MKRMFRRFLVVVTLLFLFWLFTSCRSSKSDKTNIEHKGTSQQKNDIEAKRQQELRNEIEKIVHKALSENMNISQKETEYDTDKPVNTETGKPPVKKERETFFQQKKEEQTKTTEQTSTKQVNTETLTDKTIADYNFEYNNTTESDINTQNESDIFLKWIGGIAISLVVLSLILRTLYKRLKKKLPDF